MCASLQKTMVGSDHIRGFADTVDGFLQGMFNGNTRDDKAKNKITFVTN